MRALLQQAIKINRALQTETRGYGFKVVSSKEEEEVVSADVAEDNLLVILRLYERTSD